MVERSDDGRNVLVIKGSGALAFDVESAKERLRKAEEEKPINEKELKNAKINLTFKEKSSKKRQDMIDKGEIEKVTEEYGLFTEHIELSRHWSAQLVRGTSISGRGEWKELTKEELEKLLGA
jgi:hypothetical protein